MAKEELIQFEGLVTEILPDARYRVQLDAGHECGVAGDAALIKLGLSSKQSFEVVSCVGFPMFCRFSRPPGFSDRHT